MDLELALLDYEQFGIASIPNWDLSNIAEHARTRIQTLLTRGNAELGAPADYSSHHRGERARHKAGSSTRQSASACSSVFISGISGPS